MTNLWSDESHVQECRECEGRGVVREHEDWPQMVGCPHCDETGIDCCPVCGSETIVEGHDCFVCDMAKELSIHDIKTDKQIEVLAEAFKNAMKKAQEAGYTV